MFFSVFSKSIQARRRKPQLNWQNIPTEIESSFEQNTITKSHMACLKTLWYLTFHDPERWRSWPNILEIEYLENGAVTLRVKVIN